MMINKRLISMMGDSKRYIAWNVVLQFLALLANIVMIFAVSRLLRGCWTARRTCPPHFCTFSAR